LEVVRKENSWIFFLLLCVSAVCWSPCPSDYSDWLRWGWTTGISLSKNELLCYYEMSLCARMLVINDYFFQNYMYHIMQCSVLLLSYRYVDGKERNNVCECSTVTFHQLSICPSTVFYHVSKCYRNIDITQRGCVCLWWWTDSFF